MSCISSDNNSSCANCGKGEEGGNSLKTCTACKMVKYCSRECQIAHRPQHKKECRKRAAELHDEQLFKEVEPYDCPVCFLPILATVEANQATFQSCCGKVICYGCILAMIRASVGKDLCPFCRSLPTKDDEEEHNRLIKLMDKGDGEAFNLLGLLYDEGTSSMPRDRTKAAELFLRGGELGCYESYKNLAGCYLNGEGVETDKGKAKYYTNLQLLTEISRQDMNLDFEFRAGNNHRAVKHLMSAARSGNTPTLDMILDGFKIGLVTKDEYEHALHGYHKRLKETSSEDRDEYATFRKDARARVA